MAKTSKAKTTNDSTDKSSVSSKSKKTNEELDIESDLEI